MTFTPVETYTNIPPGSFYTPLQKQLPASGR